VPCRRPTPSDRCCLCWVYMSESECILAKSWRFTQSSTFIVCRIGISDNNRLCHRTITVVIERGLSHQTATKQFWLLQCRIKMLNKKVHIVNYYKLDKKNFISFKISIKPTKCTTYKDCFYFVSSLFDLVWCAGLPLWVSGLQGISRSKLNMSIRDYFADCVTVPFMMCRCSF